VTRHITPVRAAAAALFGTIAILLVVAGAAPATPVSEAKERLSVVRERLNAVYTESETAVEAFNQAAGQLETVEQQIEENQRQLESAMRNLESANEQLKLRAESIYKSRDVGIVDVLFEADTFDELVTQMDLMERLGNSDVDTVHAIAAYRRDIKDRRVKLKADEQAAARLLEEREAHKNELIALKTKLERLTKRLKAQIKRLKREARLRAQLALTGYSGPLPPPVDPNSPGHPEIIEIAKRYFGVPYVWGGAGPSGFDCSGLTMYCYAQIGIHMYHGATVQQQQSTPVALSDMRPGDLVFFGNASFSHHVGIYAGGDVVIEAPHTGDVVRYGPLNGRSAWIGGRF